MVTLKIHYTRFPVTSP